MGTEECVVIEKPEQMSWGGYKPDKKAWVTEGFGEGSEGGQPGGWSK